MKQQEQEEKSTNWKLKTKVQGVSCISWCAIHFERMCVVWDEARQHSERETNRYKAKPSQDKQRQDKTWECWREYMYLCEPNNEIDRKTNW